MRIVAFMRYCPKNHHAATWGHDPVYGWFFGPLNITSRMITFRDFQTYHVVQEGNTFKQFITTPSSSTIMLANAIESWSEDSKRLWASVVKQKLHMQSDKFTKTGLPLPFVDAETAQALLMDGTAMSWRDYLQKQLKTSVL